MRWHACLPLRRGSKQPRLEAVALACPAQRGALDNFGIGIGIGIAVVIGIRNHGADSMPISIATPIPIPKFLFGVAAAYMARRTGKAF